MGLQEQLLAEPNGHKPAFRAAGEDDHDCFERVPSFGRSVSDGDVEAAGVEIGEKCDTVPPAARWLPLTMIGLSAISFSLQALCAKKLTLAGVPTFQVIIVRGIFQILGCCATLTAIRRPVRTWLGESRLEVKLLCWRGLIGFGGISFGFLAISRLPLCESQVIGQIVPVFAATYAWFLLGERWYLSEFVSAVAAIVGVAFIVRPGDSGIAAGGSDAMTHLAGVLCGLCSAACAGAAYVFVRLLGTAVKVHWSLALLYQALGQSILGAVALFAAGQQLVAFSHRTLVTALSCGVLGFSGQAAMTWGMQREKSALAAVVRQALTPFCAFLLQVLFLPSEEISASTILGFLVILSGLTVAVIGKIRRESAAQ